MSSKSLLALALLLVVAPPLAAQVPSQLSGRLLFKFGTADAGHETYFVERIAHGYRLGGDIDLRVMGLHIVQHLEVEAGERLQFRHAEVRARVNDEVTLVKLTRRAGQGIQERTTGDSTVTQQIVTPESSVLLTNNVIHHIAQFAWLHDGGIAESREFVAFPRVPVTVVLEDTGTVRSGDEALSARRYFLNLANRVGAYVWLSDDGTPLKISIPLQAFEAVEEAYRALSDALTLTREERLPDPGSEADYHSEDVSVDSDTITLAGTLTVPSGEGPWPAAVLISGSGPQDRDENTPGPGGLKLGIFQTIADTLTRRGIAVLRYDDRGVGGSGGDLATSGLSDLVADVQAAVRYLRGRPEIDPSRVALIGHSEGGIIAPVVAAEDRELAAIVLMAGTAVPLDSVLVEQFVSSALEAGGDSVDVAEARETVHRLAEAIRAGRSLEDLDLPRGVRALAGAEKWLREHFEHDPVATVQKVRAPILVVNGGQDIQVAPEHAYRLGAALGDVGHPDYGVKIFPKLNHLFAVSRGQGSAEYSDPDAEVDPGFLSYLADWLVARLER